MPNYTSTLIVTIGDLNADSALRMAQTNLANKSGGAVVSIDALGSLANMAGARIYLHGHGDFYNMTLGGLDPETIADRLVAAGMTEAELVSITGCNAARGIHCRQVLNQVWNDPSLVPGVTAQSIQEDSRLVDTSLSARALCHGSIAQRLHKQLLDKGVKTTVYARLFVVTIEGDGRKRTMQSDVWDDEGFLTVTPVQRHQAPRSKISITAQPGKVNGQMFDFVH